MLEKFEAEYEYVKRELLNSYKESTDELDRIFNTIRNTLVE